jgi:hypothetical protein
MLIIIYNNNLFVSYAINHRIDAAVDEYENDGEAVVAAVDVVVGFNSTVKQKVVHLVRSPANDV